LLGRSLGTDNDSLNFLPSAKATKSWEGRTAPPMRGASRRDRWQSTAQCHLDEPATASRTVADPESAAARGL